MTSFEFGKVYSFEPKEGHKLPNHKVEFAWITEDDGLLRVEPPCTLGPTVLGMVCSDAPVEISELATGPNGTLFELVAQDPGRGPLYQMGLWEIGQNAARIIAQYADAAASSEGLSELIKVDLGEIS